MDTSTPRADSPEVHSLIERGRPLVDRIAKKIRRNLDSSYQLDDLIAAGTIGLLEAARRFDPSHGVPFEGFAYHRVQGEIYNEVGRASELKGTDYHKAVALEAAMRTPGNDACEAGLQMASLDELSGLSEGELEAAADALFGSFATATAVGLLRPALEGSEATDDFDVEEEFEKRQLVGIILKLLDELDPEDADIFRKKHLGDRTIRHICAELGLSQTATFRRYSRALSHLQRRLRDLEFG